jgi:hypothetical protein
MSFRFGKCRYCFGNTVSDDGVGLCTRCPARKVREPWTRRRRRRRLGAREGPRGPGPAAHACGAGRGGAVRSRVAPARRNRRPFRPLRRAAHATRQVANALKTECVCAEGVIQDDACDKCLPGYGGKLCRWCGGPNRYSSGGDVDTCRTCPPSAPVVMPGRVGCGARRARCAAAPRAAGRGGRGGGGAAARPAGPASGRGLWRRRRSRPLWPQPGLGARGGAARRRARPATPHSVHRQHPRVGGRQLPGALPRDVFPQPHDGRLRVRRADQRQLERHVRGALRRRQRAQQRDRRVRLPAARERPVERHMRRAVRRRAVAQRGHGRLR